MKIVQKDYIEQRLEKSGKENLGFIERIKLHYLGRRDGKYSLVGVDTEGKWTYLTINR